MEEEAVTPQEPMISFELPGRILVLDTTQIRPPIQIGVTLSYDGENDPLAVQMLVDREGEETVAWYFSRLLLANGINNYSPVGAGDVKVRRSPRNTVVICLRSPSGHADIEVPIDSVVQYLAASMDAYIRAEDRMDELVDRGLKELLA